MKLVSRYILDNRFGFSNTIIFFLIWTFIFIYFDRYGLLIYYVFFVLTVSLCEKFSLRDVSKNTTTFLRTLAVSFIVPIITYFVGSIALVNGVSSHELLNILEYFGARDVSIYDLLSQLSEYESYDTYKIPSRYFNSLEHREHYILLIAMLLAGKFTVSIFSWSYLRNLCIILTRHGLNFSLPSVVVIDSLIVSAFLVLLILPLHYLYFPYMIITNMLPGQFVIYGIILSSLLWPMTIVSIGATAATIRTIRGR
jgi:hypothetical protein